MKTINFEKKKIILLTNERYKSYFNQKLNINTLMIKIIVMLNIIVIIMVNTEVLRIVI